MLVWRWCSHCSSLCSGVVTGRWCLCGASAVVRYVFFLVKIKLGMRTSFCRGAWYSPCVFVLATIKKEQEPHFAFVLSGDKKIQFVR